MLVRKIGTAEKPVTGPLTELDEEREFYAEYSWAVNALPTVGEIVAVLPNEIARLRQVPRDWRRREVMTNVWLLACGISDALDDWLHGDRYDFSKVRTVPLTGIIVAPIEHGLTFGAALRARRQRKVARWRREWERAVATYLHAIADELAGTAVDAFGAASHLASLLSFSLPDSLLGRRINLPSAFRSQDLSLYDLATLADKFAAHVPERTRPITVVGCRTAGSYFVPMLRACLAVRGFTPVDSMTLRPDKGTSDEEASKLRAVARSAGVVVLTDEPVGTGATLIAAIRSMQRLGIATTNIIALLPMHPHQRGTANALDDPVLQCITILRLDPNVRYKNRALQGDDTGTLLRTYIERNGVRVEAIDEDARNLELGAAAETGYHSRLKRLFEVRVRTPDGTRGVRHVLAKSVGCGWLSYHAFLAGVRLSPFVPPVIGLRDGILFTEWLESPAAAAERRARPPRVAARYIAARVRHLRLPAGAGAAVTPADHKAVNQLALLLSRAYGKGGPAFLRRARLLQELQSSACPVPTLIDGRMRPQEWIASGKGLRKSDFEHHAQGKLELNAVDPAYDLADTILTWDLSQELERELIRDYALASGDRDVGSRLFYNKLLAGSWAMTQALENLADPRLAERHAEFDRRYVEAWRFLVEHTARACGERCGRPDILSWTSPLVVLDLDGVVDDQIFGFPSTTAAGILAIALLHAHGYAIAFNSARSLRQLKSYADAYGAVGVVAEYGAVVWDAVADRERVLLDDESQGQLDRLKDFLRRMPGVFVSADYPYSLRAHLYERGTTVTLPPTLVDATLARLGTNRVRSYHTETETTLVAREIDKGTGLSALLELAARPGMETTVIGDSAPDLAMFRIAARSYAPGHIACRGAAELLGCRIATGGYQRGLLESVRAIVHPDGTRCDICTATAARLNEQKDLFVRLLRVADRPYWSRLLTAVLDPRAIAAFRR